MKEPLLAPTERPWLHLLQRTLLILNLFHEQLDAAVANESMPARLFRGSIDELCSDAQNHLTELVTNSSRSLVNATLRKAPSPSIAASFDPSYARRLQSAGVVPPRPVDLPTEKAIVSLWQQTFYHWKQAATLYETILGPPGSNRWELIEVSVLPTLTCFLTDAKADRSVSASASPMAGANLDPRLSV